MVAATGQGRAVDARLMLDLAPGHRVGGAARRHEGEARKGAEATSKYDLRDVSVDRLPTSIPDRLPQASGITEPRKILSSLEDLEAFAGGRSVTLKFNALSERNEGTGLLQNEEFVVRESGPRLADSFALPRRHHPGRAISFAHGHMTLADCSRLAALLGESSSRAESIEELYLSKNNIGAKGMAILAPAIAKLSNLRVLGVRYNSLGLEGTRQLAPALSKLQKLRDLGIGANDLSDEAKLIVLHAIFRSHPSPHEVTIHWESSTSPWRNPWVRSSVMRRWAIGERFPPSLHFLMSLLCLHGKKMAAARWFIVSLHIFAAFLPGLLSRDKGLHCNNDDDLTCEGSSKDAPMIVSALQRMCNNTVPQPWSIANSYIDPMAGLVVVSITAFLFVSSRVLWKAAKHRLRALLKSAFEQLNTGQLDDPGLAFDASLTSAQNKVNRSFFLLVHSLTISFTLSSYFLWENEWPVDQHVLCRVARSTTIIFLKPLIISALYCLNYLLDNHGWMLFHNPITDSIVQVVLLYFYAWSTMAIVFSGPLAVVFFFFAAMFFLPPLIFGGILGRRMLFTPEFKGAKHGDRDIEIGMKTQDGDWNIIYEHPFEVAVSAKGRVLFAWDEEKFKAASLGQMIFKRLVAYSVMSSSMFAVTLMPLYLGEGYRHVVERVALGLVRSLVVWLPRWYELVFSWPRYLDLSLQVVQAVSVTAISVEYLLLGWCMLMAELHPRGWSIGYYSRSFSGAKKGLAA